MKRILASAVLVLTGVAGTLVYVHDNWTNDSTTLKPASDQSAAPAPASTPETVETVAPADSTTMAPPATSTTEDVNAKLTQVDQKLVDHEDRISKLEITTTTTTLTKKDSPVVQTDPIPPADPVPTTTTTTQPKVWVEVARFTSPSVDSFRQPDQMPVHLETGVLRVTLKQDPTTPGTQFAVWINDGETYAPTAETVLAGPTASSMDGAWPAGDHTLSLGSFNPDRVKKWIGLTIKEYGRIGTVVVEELR